MEQVRKDIEDKFSIQFKILFNQKSFRDSFKFFNYLSGFYYYEIIQRKIYEKSIFVIHIFKNIRFRQHISTKIDKAS